VWSICLEGRSKTRIGGLRAEMWTWSLRNANTGRTFRVRQQRNVVRSGPIAAPNCGSLLHTAPNAPPSVSQTGNSDVSFLAFRSSSDSTAFRCTWHSGAATDFGFSAYRLYFAWNSMQTVGTAILFSYRRTNSWHNLPLPWAKSGSEHARGIRTLASLSLPSESQPLRTPSLKIH
jgi:hypothetical protein